MIKVLRYLKGKAISTANLLPVNSDIIGTPRRSINVAEYIKTHPKADVQTLKKEEFVVLAHPQLNTDEIPIPYLAIKNRTTPHQYILQLENARVWGSNGAVITKEDIFIKDVSREFGVGDNYKKHSVFHNVLLKKANFINEEVAVVTTAGADVYYHWLLDILPRLIMLKEAGLTEKIAYYVINYKRLPFQRQTLDMLGIDEDKIINCYGNRDFHIRAKHLYVPSLPSKLNEVNRYECELLKKYLAPKTTPSGNSKRIYISRKNAGTRMVANEAEVLAYLAKYDFTVLEIEKLSIKEQIAVFNCAEIITGPHGSAYANIIFSKPGTLLLDILPDTNIVPCFYNIAEQVNVKYYGYIGKGVPMNSSKKNDHIQVDLEKFSPFFESILNNDCHN